MKAIKTIKFYLLLISITFGTAQAQNRTVIQEHFTNTRCGVCSSRNPGLYQNLRTQQDVLHVAYHPSSPYSSCVLNQHNSAENDARTNYYSIYGSTPRIVISGVVQSSSTNYGSSSIFTPFKNIAADVSVLVKQTVEGNLIKSTILVKRLTNAALSNLKLHVLYVEDTLFYNAPNGESQHYDVFRKAASDIQGVNLILPANINDSVVTLTQTVSNSAWNKNRIYTLAFVQNASDKTILNAAKSNSVKILIAPKNLKYIDSIVIATRTITNINSSVTYLGDSIASFSISPNLPNGVSLNTTTGKISGIPTVTMPLTAFTVTGTNNGGSTTASFRLTVKSIAPTNLKYNDSIVIASRTITNINSLPNYSGDSIASFRITPSLPNGVSLNTLTGRISGIPIVPKLQTNYIITGTNSGGSSTASFRLTVNNIAPSKLKYNDSIVIATRTITNINSSVTYSGDSITSFSITPSLPNGVNINTTTGKISGIPTVTIPQTIFTIIGTNNGGSTTASFRLAVNRIAPSNLKYNDSIVIATRTITYINSSVTYSGDSIASFSITPSLPSGVNLNIATGLISGIPTVTIPLTIFTITGTNNGGSTTASFTLTVTHALAIKEVNNNTFSNINFKPNPFTNLLEISFESTTKETTKLVIIDAVGKVVFYKNIQSTIGNNTIIIDEMAQLKSGNYFARLENNNGLSQSFKLVKE